MAISDVVELFCKPELSDLDGIQLRVKYEEMLRDHKSKLPTVFHHCISTKLAIGTADLHSTGVFQLLDFAIWCAKQGILDKTFPLTLLEDIIDMQSRVECVNSFEFLESRLEDIMSLDARANRTVMLRLCNGLLRRLSKHLDMGLAGRVLLLLANALPFEDRSGLNSNSRFAYAAAKLEESEITVVEDGSSFSDSDKHLASFYDELWSLPNIFANPNILLQNQSKLDSFATALDKVLKTFESVSVSIVIDDSDKNNVEVYFPKYLQSKRLLHLQLLDPTFRLNILCQALITLHYLTLPVCFKRPGSLSKAQIENLKSITTRVFSCVEQIPPSGTELVKVLQLSLDRESTWSSWKDNGWLVAGSDKKRNPADELNTDSKRVKFNINPKAENSFIFGGSRTNLIKMGNSTLAKLWDLPSHEEFMKDDNVLKVQPHEQKYIYEVAKEEDPLENTDDDFKNSASDKYVFRAMRVIGRSNFHLFQSCNGVLKNVVSEVRKFNLKGEKEQTTPQVAPTPQPVEVQVQPVEVQVAAIENSIDDSKVTPMEVQNPSEVVEPNTYIYD